MEDVGKFRPPSLRDVMRTGPWMHMIDPTAAQAKADLLLKTLKLTNGELKTIVAFMKVITATQYHMGRPELPRYSGKFSYSH